MLYTLTKTRTVAGIVRSDRRRASSRADESIAASFRKHTTDKGVSMRITTDILIIGTGTAGYTLAMKCRKGGRKVAMVDSRPYGGTCAMRGCQPKKYLVDAARTARMTRQMSGIGIQAPAQMDWSDLMKSKAAFTDAVPERTKKTFAEAGIEMFHGTARFLSADTVRIDETSTVEAGIVVIAAGARPASLDIPGEELLTTSDEFLELKSLPKRIVFVGGGFISLEFAHVVQAAGTEATVLQRGERILKTFDAETVEHLTQSSRSAGVTIVTGFPVCSVERDGDALIARGNDDCHESYRADLVVHGAGRVPNLEALDLERGEVAYSENGVQVNGYLQSESNPRVYAIGDAVDTPFRLATTADMEAETAAENILHGKKLQANYAAIPRVVFALPPLAGVGMTEEQAAAGTAPFRINRGRMDSWPSSRRIGQERAFYKVIIEEENSRILGAHLFAHNADEMINIFALAIKFGLTTRELQSVLWAYPTSISDCKYMLS